MAITEEKKVSTAPAAETVQDPLLTSKQEVERALKVLEILASDKAITDVEEVTHWKIQGVIDLGKSKEEARIKIEETIYQGVQTIIKLVETQKASVDNIDLFHSWEARLRNRNQPLNVFDHLRLRDLFRSVKEL